MSQRKSLYFDQGESRLVSNQWAAECEERGATIETSVWAFTDEGSVGGALLTGTLATARLTPVSSGKLTNTVELSDGDTLVAWRFVEVQRYC